MILKEASGRDDDIHAIERLAAANPRIRDKAESEIRKIRSGMSGEDSAAHFLDREFRDSKRVAVLHDIRISAGDGDFAQIDHLLIHRIQGTAWILETKNYAGDMSCDEHGDWVVFYNRRPTAIPSPVEQAKRQAIVLERWLKRNEIKGISRINTVVLTNPRARITRKHLKADDHVVKSDNFARWYQKQVDGIGAGTALAMVGRFLVSGMDEMQLRMLGRRIGDAHQPASFDWAARLGVSTNGPSDRHTPVSASAIPPLRKLSPLVEAVAGNRRSAPKPTPTSGDKGEVSTPIGIIRTQTLDDGRVALRHDRDDRLSNALSNACRGRGQWNPRYKNWIVRADDLSSILAAVR